ncbi:metal-dependent hydrolase family protein [Vulcanisaeta souniana]|uniref:Amidohydrolase n=1 Tax=Vulcanisaeta souniana JCM 11219 TaxID=1293586 RepID=A0A830EFD6_9CREN|nr:amidohydrolase family protein [Vulcanisaeta souniana]BDR90972.1 amidohydrolase [Vulcanisaeta souniana JCM 11219]GGI79713.1 amidohydrolase [Vulcanisaeta souniana JCM 11219]
MAGSTYDLVIRGGLVFDGEKSIGRQNIYVKGNVIVKVTTEELSAANEVDARDMFVMPGLIDTHLHLTGIKGGSLFMGYILDDARVRLLRAANWARELLIAGFTAVRDCGEPNSIALRNAINEGIVPGPRIIAAGAPLTQTFGHGELSHSIPLEWSIELGFAEICDGVDECRKAARKVLRSGADFIKIMATGGVLSQRDKPEWSQFTFDEIRAIVQEAEKVGTYVAAHAHGDLGARIAVEAGVRTIEHGTLLRDETLRLMAERGVSITPTMAIQELIYRYGKQIGIDPWGLEKIAEVRESVANVVRKAREYGVTIIMGTDLGFKTNLDIDMGKNWVELQLMTEIGGLSSIDTLRAATSNAARMLKINTGLIREGVLADIIVINGNPVENIKDVSRAITVIKDGKIAVEKGKLVG